MRRIISIFIILSVLFSLGNACMAEEASIVTAIYNNDTEKVTISAGGLLNYKGKEATMAIFDIKEPGVPVYLAQKEVDSEGNVNFEFGFYLQSEKDADEYEVRMNIENVEILSKNLKSLFDKNCRVYVEDLSYTLDGGTKSTLNAENISNLYGENANVSFNIKGMGAMNQDTIIIAAVKVDRRLSNIEILYNDNIEFQETVPLSFDLDFPENGELEIYAWQSFGDLKPLRKIVQIKEDKKIALSLFGSDEPIYSNPGKGYLRYATSGTQSDNVLKYASAGYYRFSWATIEPSEGEYNWKPIDDAIAYWQALGKRFAFGVYNASTAAYTSYVTPKWVFDAGAQYTQTTLSNSTIQYTPVWNDEIFMQKVTNFVNALAERYDGNEGVEFIDVRSYGNYGEMHVSGLNSISLSTADKKKHLDIYVNAFDKTPLMVNTNKNATEGDFNKYAVSRGVGLRHDGVANNLCGAALTLPAKGQEPIAFEFAESYGSLKNNAANASSAADRRWDPVSYRTSFETICPSYMDLGQYSTDSDLFISDNEAMVKDMADRLGYKLSLKNIVISESFRAGDRFNIRTYWENSGVSKLYRSCNFALVLLDNNGTEVKRVWLDNTDAKAFESCFVTKAEDSAVFGTIADGNYTLAIGLFENKENQKANYKIANLNQTANGLYPIANANVSGGLVTITNNQSAGTKIDEVPNYDTPSEYVPNGKLVENYQIDNNNFIWTGKNGASVTTTTVNPYSGSYCGKIYNRSNVYSGGQLDITESLLANGAGTYQFSGKFRGDSSMGITIYVPYTNAGGKSYSTNFYSIGSSWTNITSSFTLTQEDIDNIAQASILIVGRDGSLYASDITKNIYFDDVQITKTSN